MYNSGSGWIREAVRHPSDGTTDCSEEEPGQHAPTDGPLPPGHGERSSGSSDNTSTSQSLSTTRFILGGISFIWPWPLRTIINASALLPRQAVTLQHMVFPSNQREEGRIPGHKPIFSTKAAGAELPSSPELLHQLLPTLLRHPIYQPLSLSGHMSSPRPYLLQGQVWEAEKWHWRPLVTEPHFKGCCFAVIADSRQAELRHEVDLCPR